eukprot:gb/GEZN01017293.1/.p1 GENE.gb/GEZN01017293.1/~~gb/GEZN01017293.1/.p1  ORF type:complete len:234 (-),score=15.40 gb/GEZN01017293.1/:83-784(-)
MRAVALWRFSGRTLTCSLSRAGTIRSISFAKAPNPYPADDVRHNLPYPHLRHAIEKDMEIELPTEIPDQKEVYAKALASGEKFNGLYGPFMFGDGELVSSALDNSVVNPYGMFKQRWYQFFGEGSIIGALLYPSRLLLLASLLAAYTYTHPDKGPYLMYLRDLPEIQDIIGKGLTVVGQGPWFNRSENGSKVEAGYVIGHKGLAYVKLGTTPEGKKWVEIITDDAKVVKVKAK